MENEFVVRKSVILKAAPSEVWKALTTPELTKKYFYGCEVHSDWEKGHRISFNRKFLWKKIELAGEIVEAVPNKTLKYTLKNSMGKSSGANQSTVTDRIFVRDGQTILEISDDVGSGDGAEKRFAKSNKGWDKVLKGLKKVVEEA